VSRHSACQQASLIVFPSAQPSAVQGNGDDQICRFDQIASGVDHERHQSGSEVDTIRVFQWQDQLPGSVVVTQGGPSMLVPRRRCPTGGAYRQTRLPQKALRTASTEAR
jgi:hypothetical protein